MSETAHTFRTILFEQSNYRDFIKIFIESKPKRGRGQLAKISEFASVHKTTLSQVLSGHKDFSLEQALKVAQFLGLNERETEFFILLVNQSRAGSEELRQFYQRQIQSAREARENLTNLVTHEKDLGPEERAIFYSSWVYAAIRNLCAIPGMHSLETITKKLNLEEPLVTKAVEFLVINGLCKMVNGNLHPGPQTTHLDRSSPLIVQHHANWRLRAMDRHPSIKSESEVAYTGVMTLSESDAKKIKKLISALVERTDEIVVPSESEKLYCLNLDWFEVVRA